MKAYHLTLLAFVILAASCSRYSPSGNPMWVDQMIQKFATQPVGNPPQSIWRYTYKEQQVYYVPAQCCDMYSSLYDVQGDVICAPDGGFTGRGDGRCPDFLSQRTGEKLIWKDSRAH